MLARAFASHEGMQNTYARWAPSLPLLASLLLVCEGATFAKPLMIYVSPSGNDSWTGSDPNGKGPNGPKASVAAALADAREQRKAGHSDSISIFMRGGVYRIPEAIVLTPEDSGTDGKHPLFIASYRNEKAVLSGGSVVKGWTKVEGGQIWRAALPAGPQAYHQFFVNGQRRTRARTPNDGFFRIQGESPQDHPARIKFKKGEIKKEWVDAGDVEVIALLAWADLRMPIRSVDEAAGVATLAGDPRPSNREANARYYIENAADALDQPGEWYWDRKQGELRYWPLPGEDLTKALTEVARPGDLVVFKGDFEKKEAVRNVAIAKLGLVETDWIMPENGYADTQAAIAVHGAVRLDGATDCLITECRFANLAGYAIDLGRGCARIAIKGNEMADLGGGGIRVGETSIRTDAFDQTSNNLIEDNDMHGLGRIYPPAVGVFILQSGGNRVAHNDIHDLYYTAVSVGWTWGYRDTPCHDNIIEFNHLYKIGQDMLSDMGAVYTLGPQKGTIIRNNLIHDVSSFTYGGWGLYPDEGSSNIWLENNVVYRTKSAGFHQHYGRENVVRNNIFAFGKEHQLMRTRQEPHISFLFETNIVYFDSGTLLGSNWASDKFVIDHNVYWDARPGFNPDQLKLAGATVEQWKARGHDTNSVIADPLFVAPEKFDFRLKAESPALKLGFKQIDLKNVGVRRR